MTDDWDRAILESVFDCVKRKENTGKIEPFPQLLAEEIFTFQKFIATVACDHDIPSGLIINLDQTPLSYGSPGKYSFKVGENVPIKGSNDKRQITATFSSSAKGKFLPMQLIYTGKTKVCLPNVEFPRNFRVTCTENHWSNQLKVTDNRYVDTDNRHYNRYV